MKTAKMKNKRVLVVKMQIQLNSMSKKKKAVLEGECLLRINQAAIRSKGLAGTPIKPSKKHTNLRRNTNNLDKKMSSRILEMR